MTMISFRADDADAAATGESAQRLHIDRSELLRDAVRRHLVPLAAEQELHAYAGQPVADGEKALAGIADRGPAEDWTDWAGASR